MNKVRRSASQIAAAALLAAAVSGCGGIDGVELNGKIFDALGVSNAAMGAKPEPKLAQRSPLVLPPDPNKLPEPGNVAAQAPAVADANWPKDRDQQRIAAAADTKRKQAEYCRDGNWKEKAMKDEVAAEANGPSGNCGSIFSVFSKNLFGPQN